MSKLTKSFFGSIMLSNPFTAIIVMCWSPIQAILNLLIKLSVWIFGCLFSITEFLSRPLIKFLHNKNNNTIKIYNYVIYTIFVCFTAFWIYCNWTLYKALPFSNNTFMKNIGITSEYWWAFLVLPVGYGIFTYISSIKEYGILGLALTIFNIVAFTSKDIMTIFVLTNTLFTILGGLYIYSQSHELNFKIKDLEDIEADMTLKGAEKIRYNLKPLKPFTIDIGSNNIIIAANSKSDAEYRCKELGKSCYSVRESSDDDLLKYSIY